MAKQVRTSPEADEHILELDTWWRENRDKAPDLFEQELAMAFRMISLAPYAGKRYVHPELTSIASSCARRGTTSTMWNAMTTCSSWLCGAR